jgi:hypothetical protein
MNDEGLTKPRPAPRRYRRHWVTLVQPVMVAAIGLGLLKISTEFYHSAVGIGFIAAALREIGSAVGPVGQYWAWQGLAPLVICAIVWTCGSPLVWALAVNATTIIEVDERQIVFCAGVFARQIKSKFGRLWGSTCSKACRAGCWAMGPSMWKRVGMTGS